MPYALYLSNVAPVEAVRFKGAVGRFKIPYIIAAKLRDTEGQN